MLSTTPRSYPSRHGLFERYSSPNEKKAIVTMQTLQGMLGIHSIGTVQDRYTLVEGNTDIKGIV